MKNLIISAGILMMVTGCARQVDLSKEIPNAYFLTSQVIKQGEKKTRLTDLKQLKIYTGTHFMYSQINPSDASSAFGVGSYATFEDTLQENVVYSSSDSRFNDRPTSFKLKIKVTPEGYNQIIKDIPIDSVSSTLTEEYNKTGEEKTSRLDGVWKEVRSFLVNGNDTTFYDRTQYKSFFRGYFMFGHTVVDSMGKTNTGMGFGTFKMSGDDNKSFEETDYNSSYPIIAGNTFKIALDMSEPDHFNQTIENSDGSRSVEFYERLK